MSDHELTCEELVEIVTEYLENGMTDAERTRFEEHVAVCEGCTNHVDQIRVTIEVAGRVTVEDLSEETKVELLAAFRGWKRD